MNADGSIDRFERLVLYRYGATHPMGCHVAMDADGAIERFERLPQFIRHIVNGEYCCQ